MNLFPFPERMQRTINPDVNILKNSKPQMLETLSVHKRKAGAYSGEKQSRNNNSQTQDSPGLHVEKGEVSFDNPFNQTVYPISSNKCCFSGNMDKDPVLAQKVLNKDFPELPKRSPKMARNNNKQQVC